MDVAVASDWLQRRLVRPLSLLKSVRNLFLKILAEDLDVFLAEHAGTNHREYVKSHLRAGMPVQTLPKPSGFSLHLFHRIPKALCLSLFRICKQSGNPGVAISQISLTQPGNHIAKLSPVGFHVALWA